MSSSTKSLPRRTVLRGLGATLALPLLDAMMPALSVRARGRASRCIGSRPSTCRTAWRWSTGCRRREGADFELTPILEPLAPFREPDARAVGPQGELELHPRRRVRIVPDRHGARRAQRGRDHRRRVDGPAAGAAVRQRDAGRPRSSSRWIRPTNAGACTGNLSCVYTHTLSWRSPTQPLPMEYNPRAVFEKLFGDSGSTDRAAREARLRQHKSILDSVNDKLAGLKQRARPAGPGQGRTSTPSRCATSSAASRRPRSSATSTCRRWTSRRACRRCSRITWR